MMSKVVAAVVLVGGLVLACNGGKESAKTGHEGHDHAAHAEASHEGHDHASHAGHDHSAHAEVMETSGDSKEMTAQKTCPIMGGKINKEVYVDYEGKRVYFCCAGCEGTFLKDPARYLKVLEERGETVEKLEG